MSNFLKVCEHESVEWIIKKVPKFSKNMFFQNVLTVVTSFDVNADVFLLGTNTGSIFLINRKNNNVQTLILKKGITICQIKMIQTIELSVAFGMENGLLFILKIPIKDQFPLAQAIQFSVPSHNGTTITCMAWSKNSEKFFAGDKLGHIYCTEIDSSQKTVTSYLVCSIYSQIIQLCYDHKCLVASTETENFIYNISSDRQIPIGSKPRNQSGSFGACFLDKLCKPTDVEIAVVRPDLRLWISDLNGVIKKTVLLNQEFLFSSEKTMSLLPSVTSRSASDYMISVHSGTIKYHLGLINFITESNILFWSNNGIILFDISTGKVVASTTNLGRILSISICYSNKVTESDSLKPVLNENKTFDTDLLEIWVLRKPLNDEESTLVRLSNIPLATSKLIIDPFYFYSNHQEVKYQSKAVLDEQKHISVESSELKEVNTIVQEPIPNPVNKQKGTEGWLPKFELNVSDTFEGVRNNVREFTKKTKEVLQREIFEHSDEDVEEALELTEEGIILKFETKIDESISLKNDDLIPNSTLKVEADPPSDITNKYTRKNNRILQIVDLDKNSVEYDLSKGPTVIYDYAVERQTADTAIDNANLMLSTEDPWPYDRDLSPNNQDDTSFKERYLYFNEDQSYNGQVDENLNSSEENHNSVKAISSSSVVDVTGTTVEPGYSCTADINKEGSTYDLDVIENPTDLSEELFDSIGPEGLFIKNTVVSSSSDQIKPRISPANIPSNHMVEKSYSSSFDENLEYKCIETSSLLDNSDDSQECTISEEKPILTDKILSSCNKWISHRGPVLQTNSKLSSLSINRRMVWLTDTKGSIHVGFKNTGEDIGNKTDKTSNNRHLQWIQDNVLSTEKIYSSPEGVILWREKSGDISVYTGVTRIWSPKVVKEKVLLKTNWEQTMLGIKDVDIDNEMAVIVTKKGELKVMNGISARISYKRYCTASIAGRVTLASTLDSIIWCVTEVIEPDTKIASQHIFACLAKDEDGKLNISYWRTVPIPEDLVIENEEHLGILGGSSAIKNIHLGQRGFAWIVTFHNLCFFSNNISSENPTGDGIWYQISLHFLYHISILNDGNAGSGLEKISTGIQTRVEKFFGYPETETRTKKPLTSNALSSVLLSSKSIPKMSLGNGLVWVTSIERNSPCVLFESNKNILGHSWVNSFSGERNRKTIASLPAILKWSNVTFGFKNILWLLNKSNEIFCYWNEIRIRNIAFPSSFGQVIKIAAHNASVVVLTAHSRVFVRVNVTVDNPIGSEWREITNNMWNKESIKHVSCFDNEIWLVTTDNVYYNDNLRKLTSSNSNRSPWKSFNFKLNEKVALIQVAANISDNKYIWSLSDPDGYLYLGVLNVVDDSFEWIYIPGPRAKSVHVSMENVWMIDQSGGEIFVRCGIDWANKPTGDYWIHVPVTTSPIVGLSVSPSNNVVVIDGKERLLTHSWSVIDGGTALQQTSQINDSRRKKTTDGDWELLNCD